MRKLTIICSILLLSTLVASNCPLKKIHSFGHCAYHIECINVIRGIGLEKECLGSSNYNITIDIVVKDAFPDLGAPRNEENLFESITSLTVSGHWPQTNLTFLQNMFRLKKLKVFNSKIREIHGSPFRVLDRLESLSLSHNGLRQIDELFIFDYPPNRMKTLSLSFNDITYISRNAFVQLSSLTELDLSYNKINQLTEEPFSNLTHLELLRLNNNQIKDLNGALNNLLKLKHLFLKYNEIQNINQASLITINHLETFDVSQNQLENLKPVLFLRHLYHFGNHSKCKIILSGNYIKYLPNSPSDDVNRQTRNSLQNNIDVFTEIDLSNNSISTIEYNAFQTIVQLTSLDLSNNNLDKFLVNSEHLKHVKYLNLSSNFLRRLQYESFSSMHLLQNLDLSYNEIDYIPDESLSYSDNFKLINLTSNFIMNINTLRIIFNREGGVLDLSNNGLSMLTIPNNEAYGLTELILSSNNISDAYLINLKDQKHLIRLHMRNNIIQELDKNSLQLPITLIYLDLSFNQIVTIGPSTFQNVEHLNKLRLSHNQLQKIEYGAFTGLTSLKDLDLSFNNIDMLDSKLLLDLKYLRTLSLRNNGLKYLDSGAWFAHKNDLTIYLDGNSFSCDWLAAALSDHYNGYSKMRPAVLVPSIGHNIESIPCEQDNNSIQTYPKNTMTDERLLVTSQKILEAVLEQSSYIKKYINPDYKKDK